MKQFTLSALIIFFAISLNSQSENNNTSKKWSFGIDAGVVQPIIKYKELGVTTIFNRKLDVGFQFGLMSSYQISESFFITPKAEVTYYKGYVLMTGDGNYTNYEINPISLDLMTYLKFRKKMKKLSTYIFIGPNLKFPFVSNKEESQFNELGRDVAVDFGIGIEKTSSKFRLSPYIRYSLGLLDINKHSHLEHLKLSYLSVGFNISI